MLDTILKRRSIRRYTDRNVSEEIVTDLLKAAMSAPSAHNQQPWEFVVITERDLLDAIPSFHPYSQMLTGAPLAILVCCNTTNFAAEDFWPQDCAAATENILLAATELGLGSVWLGVYPREDLMKGLKDLLTLPEHIKPFAIISLGYPAVEKGPSNRFDPARVHRNGW